MTGTITVLGVIVGLALGGFAGLRGGRWAEGNATRYWSLNAAAFLGSLLLDLAGLFVHAPWLSYGALGLMAGLITGLKYGHSPTLRVWEPPTPRPAEQDGDAETDARVDTQADAATSADAGPHKDADARAGDRP